MFCVVFDINWAIVRNEWLFGAFVGVAWHCRALYGVDGRRVAECQPVQSEEHGEEALVYSLCAMEAS